MFYNNKHINKIPLDTAPTENDDLTLEDEISLEEIDDYSADSSDYDDLPIIISARNSTQSQ